VADTTGADGRSRIAGHVSLINPLHLFGAEYLPLLLTAIDKTRDLA
jgi:hypothetical protein